MDKIPPFALPVFMYFYREVGGGCMSGCKSGFFPFIHLDIYQNI